MWSGKDVARWLSNISSEQIQPAGVDLTVEKIFKLDGVGSLKKDKVELPKYVELSEEDNQWVLKPGEYIISYQQIIKIPENAIGLVLPRSSLMRMGAMVFTAVWDPGYVGKGASLLVVFNKMGVVIEKGARISQLILIKAKAKGSYTGRYFGEGLE